MLVELVELRREVVKEVRPYRASGIYVEPLVKDSDKVVVQAGKVYPSEVRRLLTEAGFDMARIEIKE